MAEGETAILDHEKQAKYGVEETQMEAWVLDDW